MNPIEIAGGLQKRGLIQGEAPIPEREYDPVHPNFHGEVDRTLETLSYASQNGAVLPVIIAQVDDENAAEIQPRVAVAIKLG